MNGALPKHRASALQLDAAALFLLVAAVTASWLALNFVYPDFETLGIRRVVSRVIIHATILIGLWFGLSRTDFSNSMRIVVWLVIAVPFTLWLAVIWRLAINGTFRPIPGGMGVPPLPVAIFAPVLVGLVLLMRSKRVAAVLDVTPPAWLVGIQVYRIFGGIFLVNWPEASYPASLPCLPA